MTGIFFYFLQCESKKFFNPSPRFSGNISPTRQRPGVLKQNLTRLLYVHIYKKLPNFIQLSLTFTKLGHIKCDTESSSEYLHFTAKIAISSQHDDRSPQNLTR